MPDLESPDLFPDRRENQEKQKNSYTKSQSNEQRSYNVRLIASGIWSRGIKCILEPDEGPGHLPTKKEETRLFFWLQYWMP